jgi:D-alanine-D-alanine ligase
MELKDKFGRVGVLMGGPSTEREISLKSGEAVLEALKQIGLDAVGIDIKTENAEENIRLIKDRGINCAFLALHGRFGEDGQIQEIMEILKVPYTGSGVLASRLAMDKIASRHVFEANGLNVPRYKVINKSSGRKTQDSLGLPLVIKPAMHGSSIGISIIDKEEDLDQAIGLAFKFDERIIIEEYIKGREVTVGILDEHPLAVIEIIPKKRFFDYEAKYQSGMTDYIVPAELKEDVAQRVQEVGLSTHKLLGCYGCSRVDIILNQNNLPYVLEVNTIPGFTATSLLPKAAKTMGIEFPELCLKLIKLAYEKTPVQVTA